MKILIAYAGKSGTTEKCAKLLCEKLQGATLADLNRQTPDIGSFDAVVIGGSIRMGQLHTKAKKLIEQNVAELKRKKAAYFICCGFAENAPKLFADNFPKELLDRAVDYQCFGGEMNIDQLHGFDRIVTKMVTKAAAGKETAPPQINRDNIDRLAEKILG
jgi:menaquinone-dependent protoporphyrinogen oxidase